MKRKIDIQTWSRKAHYEFFSTFEEPFYGVCVNVDCQTAYEQAKLFNTSFFIYYLHQSIKAVNATEAFCYRLENDEVYLYESINAGTTIDREDGTFGFGYILYNADYQKFEAAALAEINKVRYGARATQRYPLLLFALVELHFAFTCASFSKKGKYP